MAPTSLRVSLQWMHGCKCMFASLQAGRRYHVQAAGGSVKAVGSPYKCKQRQRPNPSRRRSFRSRRMWQGYPWRWSHSSRCIWCKPMGCGEKRTEQWQRCWQRLNHARDRSWRRDRRQCRWLDHPALHACVHLFIFCCFFKMCRVSHGYTCIASLSYVWLNRYLLDLIIMAWHLAVLMMNEITRSFASVLSVAVILSSNSQTICSSWKKISKHCFELMMQLNWSRNRARDIGYIGCCTSIIGIAFLSLVRIDFPIEPSFLSRCLKATNN